MEKITIPIRFDHTFLSLLMGSIPALENVESFDKELFASWKEILETNNIEELDLTFSVLDNGKVEELLPEGNNMKVNDANKHFFIERWYE